MRGVSTTDVLLPRILCSIVLVDASLFPKFSEESQLRILEHRKVIRTLADLHDEGGSAMSTKCLRSLLAAC